MATRTRKTTRRRTSRAVGKKRVHRRRRSVSGIGSTAVGRTRRRRSHTAHHAAPRRRRKAAGSGRGFLGATGSGTSGDLMNIAKMAVGVGIGAAGTHMVLRPLEHKIAQHHPGVAKFMAVGEVLVGGLIAVKSKNNFVKAVGVGILANGVHGVMKQLPFGMHSPSESIAGMGEYTTLNVPMSGLIEDGRAYVRTPTVGQSQINGSILRNNRGGTHTPVVGDMDMGMSEEQRAELLSPKGYR